MMHLTPTKDENKSQTTVLVLGPFWLHARFINW